MRWIASRCALASALLVLTFFVLRTERQFAPARAASIASVTLQPSLEPSVESTPVAGPTNTSTSRPIPPTRIAVPVITAEPEAPRRRGRHAKHVVFPTPTGTSMGGRRRRRPPQKRRARTVTTRTALHTHHRRYHTTVPKSTPSPTATPTPSPPPPISLQVENSVAPIICNGPTKPPARHPFLSPPYRGWTNLVSYFDHDMPNFSRNGHIAAAPALLAQADTYHYRSDFPAYWDRKLRQYLYYDGHNGYDYDLRYQPVHAAAPGKVIFAQFEYLTAPDHGYGLMVMIDHQNGYVTLYGHFATLQVKAGQRVKRGQTLGISGNTGRSTGPHLHFTVFHNCSPTDPYGWTGQGPDPLEAYQGETSTALWVHLPLVLNPPPGWYVSDAIPPQATARMILLRLPATRGGIEAFTTALGQEMRAVQAAIDPGAVVVRTDILRGGLIVNGPISASRLYALPDVASLASPDVSGTESDTLASLARAAMASSPPGSPVWGPTWSGYLIRWRGRAVLVGRQAHGMQRHRRLLVGSRQLFIHAVGSDETTGAYAADLGTMSPREVASLAKKPPTRGSGGSSPSGTPGRLPSSGRVRTDPGRNTNIAPLIPASLALVLIAVTAAVLRLVRQARQTLRDQ